MKEHNKAYISEKELNFSVDFSKDLEKGYTVFPGFCDVHVHFREPGFCYKETIETGSKASAHGGYTTVCTMPNLNPVPDSVENLKIQLDAIKKDAVIQVVPYGAITEKQCGKVLSDMDGMKDSVVAFSDDGKGVQSDEMMQKAMEKAKMLDKIIVAHCEDNSLLFGGYVHDGEYAKAHGHNGICSKSEYKQIERDLNLVRKTGCRYHVCHISTKESVELIRHAKREGLDVTCETAPHYLVLDDSNLKEDGCYKMNPPLRSKSDKEALIDGIKDGTIDMIATDHAPHSKEEKSKGLKSSAFGIVGIETAFATVYTYLVRTGIITMEKLVELLSTNARKRFNLQLNGYTVFDLNEHYVLDEQFFLSKGKATPFLYSVLYGTCKRTVVDGKTAYETK